MYWSGFSPATTQRLIQAAGLTITSAAVETADEEGKTGLLSVGGSARAFTTVAATWAKRGLCGQAAAKRRMSSVKRTTPPLFPIAANQSHSSRA